MNVRVLVTENINCTTVKYLLEYLTLVIKPSFCVFDGLHASVGQKEFLKAWIVFDPLLKLIESDLAFAILVDVFEDLHGVLANFSFQ